jgi:hypothetical protein
MKDTQQTLTKKVLSGTVTTAGDTDKTSDMVISSADITANKIVMPSLQNSNDRPDDKNVKGAMHLSPDSLVFVGNGTGYQVLVDMSSLQTLQQKTLNADVNTISNLNPAASSTFKTVAGHADKVVKYDNSGVPQVAKITNANIDDAAGISGSKLSDNSVAVAKLSSMSSADLAGKITDETGSGALVFANNPTIGSITAASGILSLSGTGALKIPAGLGSERPASPVEGMIRYNSETDSFEGYASNTWSGIGGGGTTDRILQVGHSFVVGDVLWLNGSTYAKAKADAVNTAEVVGVVSRVIDVDNFEMTLSGEISGLSSLTPGEVYFLSASTAGALTVTEPSVIGQVSLPVGVASSASTLYVAPKRGVVVGSANARTTIPLNGATLVSQTTTIQNASAYEAGELTGWVFINATSSKRFYVAAQFARTAAGSDYNLSYQTTGETPPAGFSMTITAAGLIQVTLPAIAGFTAANINFALNAPAVGATLPLQISGANVTGPVLAAGTGAAVAAGYVGEVIYNTQQFPSLGLNPNSFGAQVTLTSGVWLCILHGSFQAQVPTDMWVRLADSSNNPINTDTNGMPTIVDCGNGNGGSDIKTTFVLRVTTPTIYKININATQPAGATNTAHFQAIRIA